MRSRTLIALFLCAIMLFSCFACASENESTEGAGLSSSESGSTVGDEADGSAKGTAAEKSETEDITEDDGGEGDHSSTTIEAFAPEDSENKATLWNTETEESELMNGETAGGGAVTEAVTDKADETTDAIFVAESEVESFTPSVTFLEDGDDAAVLTADGLEFLAYGHDSINNDRFVISDDFCIDLNQKAFGEFNRVTLCYSSSAALRCTVEYLQDGKVKRDDFFLEAGSNIFSGLIEDYLDGCFAEGLVKISFEVISGESAELMVYNVVCSQRRVYNDDTYYLENDRFKIGLRLIWGGGICCIEDKTCEITKVGNLINIHDAGRLVQQSYYGTPGNDEYTPGDYNGTPWVYNPVQGGDQFWNKSRLIDIIVREDSVYVKAQPQDWSLDNKITPSYMENTYTVYDDRIVVDNRFVDFSGWEHRFAHQELPAFYTISYLDSFSYYNGLSPWTDGELIRHDNLPFSGGEEKEQCYFKFLSSNTETWCAWTNAEDDFGIGLYTPNADMVLAGRFKDGHSKNPNNDTCSYVAPVGTLMIESFVPISYSYMITTGTLEDIRSTFKANKDFADNAYLFSENSKDISLPDVAVSYENINFATAEHNKYLEALNSASVRFNSTYDAVVLSVRGEDPQVNILYGNAPTPLRTENYGRIVIEYMMPASNAPEARAGEMFLCTGSTVNAEAGKSVALNYVADGKWHTLEINVADLDFWSGRINAVRLDFVNAGNLGDAIYIRSIRLVK